MCKHAANSNLANPQPGIVVVVVGHTQIPAVVPQRHVLAERAHDISEAKPMKDGRPLVVLLSLRPPVRILLEFTDGEGQGLDGGKLPNLHEPDFLRHDHADSREDLTGLEEQPAANLTTEEGVAMALWTHLAQETWLGSVTAALVPDPTLIIAECRHSGLRSYGGCTILILEKLRDAVGHRQTGNVDSWRAPRIRCEETSLPRP